MLAGDADAGRMIAGASDGVLNGVTNVCCTILPSVVTYSEETEFLILSFSSGEIDFPVSASAIRAKKNRHNRQKR